MRSNNQTSTFAFTVKFEYEVPDVAVKVTNEFLTEILSADASRRTSTASETTKLVEQQVKQARDQHDAVVAQIEKLKSRPPDQAQIASDDVKAQTEGACGSTSGFDSEVVGLFGRASGNQGSEEKNSVAKTHR